MSEISDFLKDSLDIEIGGKPDLSEIGKMLDEKDVPEDGRIAYSDYHMLDVLPGLFRHRCWRFILDGIGYDCYLTGSSTDIHWSEGHPGMSEIEYIDTVENFEKKFENSDMSGLTCIPVNIRALLPQSYFDRKALGKYVAKTYSEFADVPSNFGPGVVPEMPEVTVGAINHCKKADGCSLCLKAGEPSNMQRQCKFWAKATFADRCMHLRFDEFCDSMEAQKDA